MWISPGGLYLSVEPAASQVPVTRMLTKAQELSGAEDRHNGRKEATSRKGGSRFSLTKHSRFRVLGASVLTIQAPMNESTIYRAVVTGGESILTGGEGGWSRISAPVSLWHPGLSLWQHGGSTEEQARALHDGKGWESVRFIAPTGRGGRDIPDRSLCYVYVDRLYGGAYL